MFQRANVRNHTAPSRNKPTCATGSASASHASITASHTALAKPVAHGVILLCLILCSSVTFAQSKYPVRMKLEPLSIRGRSGGPIPIRIKLEYNSHQIMEGDLVLDIFNSVHASSDLTATIRYEGIVLQGGDYFFETVLPPIEHSSNKQYQLTAWFETANSRIPLSTNPKNPDEPRELLSIGPHQRAMLMCSCAGDSGNRQPSTNRRFLNRALALDNYNPLPARNKFGRARRDGVTALHYAANWDALDLPEDPLRLCSFDVVLLADGALSRLEAAQLTALTTWCEAGGSVCVLPDDRNLKGIHLQFLQRLFERADDPDLNLRLTDDGTLLVISNETSPVVNRRPGLGRATLLPVAEELSSALTPAALGQVVGHLWKVHSDSPVHKGQPWKVKPIKIAFSERGHTVTGSKSNFQLSVPRGEENMHQSTQNFASLDELALHHGLQYALPPTPGKLAAACESALLPFGVEMVPAWVIGVLLMAYVITIGPVDYLVLGMFRLRKYTWILFPVVTVFFTGLTIGIAHNYMASSETGGSLTIVDLVDDGHAVRQTSIQMHFHGQQTTLKEDLSQSFIVPAQMIVGNFNPNGVSEGPRAISPKLDYAGRFPQSFQSTISLRQWEPQMTRSMTLAPDNAKVPGIAWNDFDLISTTKGRQQLQAELSKLATSGQQLDAIVLHGEDQHPVFPSGIMFSKAKTKEARNWLNQEAWYRQHQVPPKDGLLALGVVDSSVRKGVRDFFSIVSQVSPQGSASMEDLPMLDATDLDQWLLLVAVREGLHTDIYRRMLFDPGSAE